MTKKNPSKIKGRELVRDQIELIWTIDRSEVIENIYYYEKGGLVLKPEHFDLHGWHPGAAEHYTPSLLECFDRGGWFYSLFDEDQLIGVVVLESKFIGAAKDQLQLVFLHVSQAYRGQGLGRQLFEKASEKAIAKGAKRLYISATPSEHTIHFYLNLGCAVTDELNAELYELEPEDIHLEYAL